MDAGGVTLQVISHGPGDLDAAQCRRCNDQLAKAIRARPRFAGFAELPMQEPEEAAKELRRVCAADYLSAFCSSPTSSSSSSSPSPGGRGFLGALVDSHTSSGTYYDSPRYDPLWAAAVDLDVPIYIHPTWPSPDLAATTAYRSADVPDIVNAAIGAFGFGWHSDVAVHVLKLYGAGVFDRFPGLKIVLGHMGEMLPYMLQRVERVTGRWPVVGARDGDGDQDDDDDDNNNHRSFRQVWDTNIWLTTSGNWALDPLACVLRNTKHDRILYSVDYPFARSADGLRWLEELERSGLVSDEVLEGIRWRNAARLLKVDLDLDLGVGGEDIEDIEDINE
ncbi:amidohydrolase family protein [Coniella lustricola]|uniref:Amidohydrolase family protein n=1 Tax=Coniella lustricola TaxID=2025994 RepID=A0A2T3AEW0_9PEZI|nr:amidohydrolase family protein [Coniella lustricola]